MKQTENIAPNKDGIKCIKNIPRVSNKQHLFYINFTQNENKIPEINPEIAPIINA